MSQETSGLKSCLRRDPYGPRLGVTWSNAIRQVVFLDPATFYYPGPLPHFPPRERRCQVPRKPTKGAEGNAKKTFFRSKLGDATFTQSEMQEFVESGMCQESSEASS